MAEGELIIYADGSCHNHRHRGGWAFLVLLGGRPLHADFSRSTITGVTSNKMEIAAVTKALEWVAGLDPGPRRTVRVVSDSQYTVLGATKWLPGWVSGGWVNYERKPVANRTEWKRLLAVKSAAEVVARLEWKWVKGHSSDFWNRAVDHLATYDMPELEKRRVADGIMSGGIHSGSHPFRT